MVLDGGIGQKVRRWTLPQGQPWLVNALAYETCFEMREGRDRTRPIDRDMIAPPSPRIRVDELCSARHH